MQGSAQAWQDPSEADLAQATAAVGTLLKAMGLSAQLYAVEPREVKWAVIAGCTTGSGWQRVEFRQPLNSWTRSMAMRGPERACSPNGRRTWTTAGTTDANR